MNNIGIIALESERVAKLKWYCFNRYKYTERFFMENYQTEAIVVYVDSNLNKCKQVLDDNNITVAVCTQRFEEKFGTVSFEGIKITQGKNVYERLVPSIIRKTVKISGIDSKKGTIAISEENPVVALSLVEKLCDDFRFITIISNNKKKACEIEEKILDEFGLPIVIADNASKVNCDIAVKTGKDIPNLSKSTILIEATTEHTITRKNTINWIEVPAMHNLPYKIDSLAFVEAIEELTGIIPKYRISGFRCGNKIVAPSSLCRTD